MQIFYKIRLFLLDRFPSFGVREVRSDNDACAKGKLKLPEDKRHLAIVWRRFGGSFLLHLGHALRYADKNNTKRILSAFPHYVDQYRKRALEEKNQILKP